MSAPLPILLGGLLLLAGTAHADELRNRASAIFQPIPEQVTEVRGKTINRDQAVLGHNINCGSIRACRAATSSAATPATT